MSKLSIGPRVVGNLNANPPLLAVAAIQIIVATFQINNA